MTKVILEAADNGVIKRVIDTNYGGSDEKFVSTHLYEIDENNLESVSQIIYELCEDLSLHIGNKFSNKTLKLNIDWGCSYQPTDQEIDNKILLLKSEIDVLKACKKIL